MKIQYLYNEEDIARSFADLVPVCKCHAIMEQVYPSDNWVCPNCDFEIEDYDEYATYGPYAELLERIHLVDPDDEWLDEPGEGCKACGCPAYPDCKTSCDLYDD